jgi:hypothetical protein
LGGGDSIDRTVTPRWTRTDAFGREEELVVPLRVCGIADRTAVHAALARRVDRWLCGEFSFIDGEFRTAMEQEAAYGARRLKVVAMSPTDVLEIAGEFEGHGYLAIHEVDKQQDLVELAGTLRDLTVVLCGAALLLSLLVVVTSVYLFYDVRKGEIASLRSLGVARRHIVKAFLLEALLFGALSFVIGIGLFALASPLYADLMARAFGMAPGALRIGLLAPGAARLLAGSFLLAMVYSLAAQILPVSVAVRRSILGAMRG